MLNVLRRLGGRKKVAGALCAGLAARAREPVFYAALEVPDTLDGRFDLLILHAWLVLERLKSAGENDTAQALTDAIFVHFDEGLRDMGVGDIGIGHRVKKMADAYYGRLAAYRDARDETALASAILRNIYRGDDRNMKSASELARYVVSAREHLANAKVADGALDFGPLPRMVS